MQNKPCWRRWCATDQQPPARPVPGLKTHLLRRHVHHQEPVRVALRGAPFSLLKVFNETLRDVLLPVLVKILLACYTNPIFTHAAERWREVGRRWGRGRGKGEGLHFLRGKRCTGGRTVSGTQVLRLGASSGDHRALLFSPCESTGRPRVKLHRSTHSSSSSRDSTHPPAHPPGAHLEAVGLDQVARAQNAVQAGQEPHRPRAEGPVFLRKGRGVQASVCRAVVRQRLQGERESRTSDKKRGHKPTEVSARVCRCVEKSRPQT